MIDLLPPNATKQERDLAKATARIGGTIPQATTQTPTGHLIISGVIDPAGSDETIYRGFGDINGKMHFANQLGNRLLFWDGSNWSFESDMGTVYFESSEDTDSPLDVSVWTEVGGTGDFALTEEFNPPAVQDVEVFGVPIRPLWNPDTCPLSILPWLAWGLSVDVWDSTWSESIKRSVVRSSIETHRKKGTVGAVKGALSALGAGSVLVEWFQKSPLGTPHTFTINLVSNDTSTEMQDAMAAAIDRTKPLRSHYDIVFGVATEGSINVVAVFQPVVFVRLDGRATY